MALKCPVVAFKNVLGQFRSIWFWLTGTTSKNLWPKRITRSLMNLRSALQINKYKEQTVFSSFHRGCVMLSNNWISYSRFWTALYIQQRPPGLREQWTTFVHIWVRNTYLYNWLVNLLLKKVDLLPKWCFDVCRDILFFVLILSFSWMFRVVKADWIEIKLN